MVHHDAEDLPWATALTEQVQSNCAELPSPQWLVCKEAKSHMKAKSNGVPGLHGFALDAILESPLARDCLEGSCILVR